MAREMFSCSRGARAGTWPSQSIQRVERGSQNKCRTCGCRRTPTVDDTRTSHFMHMLWDRQVKDLHNRVAALPDTWDGV